MMRSVQRYEEGLRNSRASLERDKESLRTQQANIERWEARVLLLERQLAEAKKRGLAQFDDAKLLIPRKKAAPPETEEMP